MQGTATAVFGTSGSVRTVTFICRGHLFGVVIYLTTKCRCNFQALVSCGSCFTHGASPSISSCSYHDPNRPQYTHVRHTLVCLAWRATCGERRGCGGSASGTHKKADGSAPDAAGGALQAGGQVIQNGVKIISYRPVFSYIFWRCGVLSELSRADIHTALGHLMRHNVPLTGIILTKLMLGLPAGQEEEVQPLVGAFSICMEPGDRTTLSELRALARVCAGVVPLPM